jgi:type 1 glutamine amidotransferase
MKTIRFFTGGQAFHPTAEQAGQIKTWLGDGFDCQIVEGASALDRLEDCDLLVLMGNFNTAQGKNNPRGYTPLAAAQEESFRRYVASGRPLLLHHGAIGSYDDSEIFTRLIGFNWILGGGEKGTDHSPIGDYRVTVPPSRHPVMAGVSDFELFDELYFKIHIHSGLNLAVHAHASYEGQDLPMVFTVESGRISGAGKLVYLANGHDLRAFACPALQQLWKNSVRWLLS